MTHLASYTFSIGAAVAVLAGCGGSQPAAGIPFMKTQSPVASRPVRQTSKSALLYVVTSDQIDMLSYPGDKVVGKIGGGYYGRAAADPNNGNVCFDAGTVYIFAHGSTKRIGIINAPSGQESYDCTFDPTTDDIAISVDTIGGPGGFIAVYQTASSTPTTYSIPSNMRDPFYLGYDNAGNLFVDGYGLAGGYVLAELPKGGATFANITLNKQLNQMWAIQWDGTYITVAGPHVIHRLQISGSSGTVVGTTTLSGALPDENTSLWIQGDAVIGPHASRPHNGRYLGFWHYPAGGPPFKIITKLSPNKKIRIGSATVSVAPSHWP